MQVQIEKLMESSGVKFGTSGARGKVVDMTDKVCYAYTIGFIQYLETIEDIKPGKIIAVAGDLRPSTPRIAAAVCQAIRAKGYTPIYGGLIPSPAVAYYGLEKKAPSIMVTGSHIPDDRNGIKYNKSTGEILKQDETGLKSQTVIISDELFDDTDQFIKSPALPNLEPRIESLYINRFLDVFGSEFLKEVKVGFYQHSCVGRDMLPLILEKLGAEVIPFGYSAKFIPVDTEAIRPEDSELAKSWIDKNPVDVLYSTDGDSDRPLIGDEKGNWLRGDIAGILTSLFLKADHISTPVSCNSALDKTGEFEHINRTKIGSPFVVESMIKGEGKGFKSVVGYEANGGYFTQSSLIINGKTLKPLPTRDTLIVFLSIVGMAKTLDKTVSQLVESLPPRFTASGRLENFPTEKSKQIIQSMISENEEKNFTKISQAFDSKYGKVKNLNRTDGLRITFENDEIIHLRPSGNAPEFRCYNEADSEPRALEMNRECLQVMTTWKTH